MSLFTFTGQSRLAALLQWVVSKLPPRLKRIMFIGMALGYFSKKEDPDQELIRRINDTFKTADSPKAYELPIAVKSILWKDIDLNGLTIETTRIGNNEVLTKESKNKICEYVSTNIPDWIRYASSSRIYSDTMRIIDTIENRHIHRIVPI